MPVKPPFRSVELVDGLFDFAAGVNTGISPLLLAKNQMANASNVTVRGTFAMPRPPYRKMILDFGGDEALQSAVEDLVLFQGAGYYNPDSGAESLIASLQGRLYKFTIVGDTATVSDITIPGDPNPSTQPQAWLWQSEKWMIVQDGLSLPIFYDGSTSVRSNWSQPLPFDTTTSNSFVIPAVGGTTTVDFVDVTNLVVGDIVTVKNKGTFIVLTIAGNTVTFVSVDLTPVGQTIAAGRTVSWQHIGAQLPPGRMGVYGLGRNWVSLTDGKQFVAGDLVGGSSGTVAENYRDAVLNITENLYLAGGGNFTVPGSVGDIRAMRFGATLDASLGQGPLQVFTPNTVFSCNAPVDRLTWQNMQNPILTESLISNGALSQWSTVLANGDFIFRSIDGTRSLILARREFNTWGNVPISREVDARLSKDSVDLLGFSSAIVFDNRHLMTAAPVLADQGVYHRAIVPLNFDPISTLRGKAPSVYDSLNWTGLNIFQLLTGEFSNEDRAFAFCFNTSTKKLELWELLKSSTAEIADNGDTPIVWTLETPVLFDEGKDPRLRPQLQLHDGELAIDDLQGEAQFQVWYRPEQYACWVQWHSWTECATMDDDGKPQYRSRMGFGEPTADRCDEVTNTPFREGKNFQLRFVLTGHFRLINVKVSAVTVPEPEFAPQCCPFKSLVPTLPPLRTPLPNVVKAILDDQGFAILDDQGNAILENT